MMISRSRRPLMCLMGLGFASLSLCTYLAPLSLAESEKASASSAQGLRTPDAQSDMKVFDNALCGALKKGTSKNAVERMKTPVLKKMAEEMLEGTYQPKFRCQVMHPFPKIETTAKRLKTSGYSQFENPTGVFFEPGDHLIFVGATKPGETLRLNDPLELRVTNFGKEWSDERYPLKPGINVIPVKNSGTGYISYYTDNPKATPVAVNVATGKVNGFFNAEKDTNEDWKKLLVNPPAETIDIMGKYAQLAFSVDALKKYCPEKGKELADVYDKIMKIEFDVMGLDRYKIGSNVHVFGRVIWKGFMHADGFGAAFHNDTLAELADPDKVPNNTWGIAHEFGHVNQTRPGLKWVSTTEVTNNIYSAWVCYNLSPQNVRLEHEMCPDLTGNIIGGRFNCYLNSGIVKGENWLCQQGPDKMEGYENGGDHFVKLAPLWQLQLYYAAALRGKNPNFYPDIFEIVRETKEDGLSDGKLQLNFMKNACDVAKEDLTDFFIKAGMLKPIDRDMDDYSRGQLTITQADCNNLVKYAKKYPKPESPVIYYISANSVDAFKNKKPIEGTYNEGVTPPQEGSDLLRVSHDVWKNVVAFETYAGDKLVKACIVGTGSPGSDQSFTMVRYPNGATRVDAVSWDGKRTTVFGEQVEPKKAH